MATASLDASDEEDEDEDFDSDKEGASKRPKTTTADLYKRQNQELRDQLEVLKQKVTATATSSSSGTSGTSDTPGVIGKELTRAKQHFVHSFVSQHGWSKVKFIPHDDSVVYTKCPTLLPALLFHCQIVSESDKAKFTTMAKRLFKQEINQRRHNLIHPIRDKYKSKWCSYVCLAVAIVFHQETTNIVYITATFIPTQKIGC